jgi:hypothetical protein
MEAPLRLPACAGLFLAGCLAAAPVFAATHRTTNFVVTAPTAEIAKQVAETAEQCRQDLAQDWLGKTLPNWYRPCPVSVKVGQIGAGGATTFTFDRGEVAGWNMTVQGTLERILDSVIPHEVSHTILASHFRRPLPRWADEGAATLIEHSSERKRQEVMLKQIINTPRRIPLQKLLAMTEYPTEMQQVYTLYAEGYSLARFLVEHGGDEGKAKFLEFLDDAHKQRSWPHAIRKHYGFETVADLEQTWTGWVVAGNPPVRRDSDERLAVAEEGPATPPAASLPPAANTVEQLAPVAVAAAVPAPAPIRAIDRPLRTVAISDSLNAPSPGEGGRHIDLSRGSDDGDTTVAIADRVTPRRDPTPSYGVPASVRLQQIMAQAAREQPRTDTVSAARTGTPLPTVNRSQSPDGSASWSDYSAFPSSQPTEKPRRWFSFE